MTHPYIETAESIVEHALAITRLDGRELGADEYDTRYAHHLHAMRLLAAPHVDPSLDRAFLKAITTAAAGAPGVAVRLVDGRLGVIVDSADRQHRFELLSPAQADRRGEIDPFA